MTDDAAPQEDDGNNNINNVLNPAATNGETNPTAAIMSGVTPESTTAALAAGVPKEAEKSSENPPGAATISSAAPDSTTAELAKDVPKETKDGEGLPGAFPITPGHTPGHEPESLSVNPLPATAGAGNPIQLTPGEKVPDPSTFTNNTVGSTARTDQASYEQNASAAGFATGGEKAKEYIGGSESKPADPTIQSAAPVSTTAALAAGVPLENTGKGAVTENGSAADDVPGVVKDSLAEAHKEPEAAASGEAVGEKKEVEQELLKEVPPDYSAGTPAPAAAAVGTNGVPAAEVPAVVAESHAEGGAPLEAATSQEAVTEKKDVENELLKKVTPEESAGEPAPTATAATTETAPVAPTTTATDQKKPVSREVSPMTKDPDAATNRAAAPEEPTVTTGPKESEVPKTSGPESSPAPAAAAAADTPAKSPAAEDNAAKKEKKKNRASGFFSRLKERFK